MQGMLYMCSPERPCVCNLACLTLKNTVPYQLCSPLRLSVLHTWLTSVLEWLALRR